MAFNWSDYNSVAKKLKTLARSGSHAEVEALHRASISRHYYAMHHIALDYAVKNLKYIPPTGNTKHKELRDWYLNYPDDNIKNISYDFLRNVIGQDLKSALSFRVRADYESVYNKVGSINDQVERRADRVLKFIG